MLDKLTKDTFEPRKGEAFKLTDEAAGEVELKLASVQGTGLQGKAPREQFSLHFHGPREPVLPQQIYHLENAEMGALDLFLVPVARDEEGMIYEAVFT
jgi:hypothetical protein